MDPKIGMVGTPCQITAATLMKDYASFIKEFPVTLKIGLFCMENFSYKYLKRFLEEKGISLKEIIQCRIEGGSAKFHLNSGETISIPLKELKETMRKSCQICMDYTSEQADISIGSVGSPQGWSTIIIRTKKGLKLIKAAEEKKYIKTKPISDKGFELLQRLAAGKKEKNLKEIKKREKVARPVMYWRVMPETEYLEEVTDYQFRDLRGDVIDIGACVLCGACLLSCPEEIIKIEDRKPEIKGECPPACNACYIACPRTYVPDNIISHETAKEPLGDYIKIVSAKAPMFKGQDGGVVTALLSYALSEGIVDKVLVVDKDTKNPWKPTPKLTKHIEDVIKAAGTKYSACPIFKAMGGS
ncbi:MAG: Coenzyme F420 hydrogenase/dehydrogenase, beta subunit C-terminal domain [Methanobacteriales archaeon]|nr:Coenzyme F420 hydrogenase/dehydrogenase, beta subunit C-terminal domain [Methanobacteriales archaeon]